MKRNRTTGQARLKRWMAKEGLSQRAAALILGIHYTHVNQILGGRRSVGLAVAVRIERCTGVPVGAWVDTSVAESSKAVLHLADKRRVG